MNVGGMRVRNQPLSAAPSFDHRALAMNNTMPPSLLSGPGLSPYTPVFQHPQLFGTTENCPPPPKAYNSPIHWTELMGGYTTTPSPIEQQMFEFPDLRKGTYPAPLKFSPYTFSRKVFVGGLPVNLPKTYIESIFSQFGEVHVDWPRPSTEGKGKNARCISPPSHGSNNSYVFLMYARPDSVERLLDTCQYTSGKYWFTIQVGNLTKAAQVRPWSLQDTNYIPDPNALVDVRNTVFVGGVPRPATAEQLGLLLEQNFGKVLYASIDIDPEQFYPKGAGRVIFADQTSYLRAIRGRFLKMDAQERHKKEIEVKPYVVEGQTCDECGNAKSNRRYADYFCCDTTCLQYYCCHCFDVMHASPKRSGHRIVVREGERTRELNEPPHRAYSTTSSSSMDDESLFSSMDRYLSNIW